MRLGLIAGNGAFPFLVLDAARAAGHQVTIIALKEEASLDLEREAARAPAAAPISKQAMDARAKIWVTDASRGRFGSNSILFWGGGVAQSARSAI